MCGCCLLVSVVWYYSRNKVYEYLSNYNTSGGGGPEMGLQVLLDGPGLVLQVWVDGLV